MSTPAAARYQLGHQLNDGNAKQSSRHSLVEKLVERVPQHELIPADIAELQDRQADSSHALPCALHFSAVSAVKSRKPPATMHPELQKVAPEQAVHRAARWTA